MKKYNLTEIRQKPSIICENLPVQITRYDEVVAIVVKPGAKWEECEECGQNTQEVLKYQHDNNRWGRLVLCKKCQEKLL